MKTLTTTVILISLFCAVCMHSRGEEFFLTEQHSGHRFGPFQYRTGEEVVISGNRFRLSTPPVAKQHTALVQKMKNIILPSVSFRTANIRDVVEFLVICGKINLVLNIKENTTSIANQDPFAIQPDPFGGVKIVSDLPSITFQAKDISMYDTLNIVCELANLNWSIENSVVMIRSSEEKQNKNDSEKWEYDGSFYDLIDAADKIVIRNGGFNCCSTVDDDTVLLSITNAQEIAEFNSLLQFETNQTQNSCMCCGFPGIDWYRGRYRLALTSIQHGKALRWKNFPGDACFTKKSSQQLAKWLLEHGIPDPHEELKEIVEKKKTDNK